jgi:uncharacterized protein (TIGR03437 family)
MFAAALACEAAAPVWDTSGNGLLNGTYYFREVLYALSSAGDGSLSYAYALYGTITFDGAGNYTMAATRYDPNGFAQGSPKGTYSISASGYGFFTHPLFSGVNIYGLVSQQKIFIGSATANGQFNDLFIAAPLASPAPTAASFKGNYWISDLDLSSGSPVSNLSSLFQLNPDGVRNLGSVTVSAYQAYGSTPGSQTISGGTYTFTNGAGVLTFPNSQTAILTGQTYLYMSPDGNFVFGGGPDYFDMWVGVKAASGTTPSFSGLYYQAGIDQDNSFLVSGGYGLLDSYYGSLNAVGGNTLEHQRLENLLLSATPYDDAFTDTYSPKSDGTYSTPAMRFVVGAGGIRIGSGIGPSLGLNVAMPAPGVTAPSTPYLYPTGVVNAGSFAPFTAALAPGELIILYGSNLAPPGTVVTPSVPFLNSLNNVQVMVNGLAAPLYYVSPGQIAAIVPYSATTPILQIQVINNGTASNIVTNFSGLTAPGVLTQSQNGLSYGDVVHQDGSLVNAKNPAKPGETVSVFLTGLGAVNPSIPDGAAGPTGTLSETTNTITAYVGGQQATVTYSGLAPGFAGLYQLNLTVPSGATAGDNFLEITGPDSDSAVCLIAVAGASTGSAAPPSPALVRRQPTRRRLN